MRLVTVLISLFIATVTVPSIAEEPYTTQPEWLKKTIDMRRASHSRDVIEEATYFGNRVFEFIDGYRFDVGDEHVLYSEGGKVICKFGGFVGTVTVGNCNIENIVFVREIYPGKHQ